MKWNFDFINIFLLLNKQIAKVNRLISILSSFDDDD